ncbi:Hypothetical protein NocV09_02400330 [Nannochloropsis oceanica]
MGISRFKLPVMLCALKQEQQQGGSNRSSNNLANPYSSHRALEAYSKVTYGQIVEEIKSLQNEYPGFLDVTTAQDIYGLESPGMCTAADGTETPCLQYILRVTDEATMRQEPERPEVFLSGCLHGNERIGPVVAMEVVRLMLEAAQCVKVKCEDSGIAPATREWLSHLVRSRLMYVMPMTNAIGYNNNQREENRIDPNRDFPYQKDPAHCMETITARAVNELWRENLFQLAITFHGGMESITYEWGSYNHHKDGHDVSPDDRAQTQVASIMSRYAGHFPGTPDYLYGRTNDVVYPVTGGMEDWAYAASWDNDFTDPPPVLPCNPSTYGGYPASQTTYNNVSLRAFNILVETSKSKDPPASMLGTDDKLWVASGEGSGHVTRNVRLALAVVDLVEPYVHWVGHSAAGCQWDCAPPSLSLTEADDFLELQWRVGGAIRVDETQLIAGPWPGGDLQTGHRSLLGEGEEEKEKGVCVGCQGEWWAGEERGGKAVGEAQSGWTRWHVGDAGGDAGKRRGQTFVEAQAAEAKAADEQEKGLLEGAEEDEVNRIAGLDDPIFTHTLDLKMLMERWREEGKQEGETVSFFLVARARVDQAWARNEGTPHPDIPPQSHVANARTNPAWHAAHNGHEVRGRLDWYSFPLKLTITSSLPPSPTEQEGRAKGEQEGEVTPAEEAVAVAIKKEREEANSSTSTPPPSSPPANATTLPKKEEDASNPPSLPPSLEKEGKETLAAASVSGKKEAEPAAAAAVAATEEEKRTSTLSGAVKEEEEEWREEGEGDGKGGLLGVLGSTILWALAMAAVGAAVGLAARRGRGGERGGGIGGGGIGGGGIGGGGGGRQQRRLSSVEGGRERGGSGGLRAGSGSSIRSAASYAPVSVEEEDEEWRDGGDLEMDESVTVV